MMNPLAIKHLGPTLSLGIFPQDCLEIDEEVVKIAHVKIFSRFFSSWTRNALILCHILYTKITFQTSLNVFVVINRPGEAGAVL